MTKRTLFIIIALLVVVDIAAAFWYLALRIENSGQSSDLFSSTDTSAIATADTIIESTVADVFKLTSHEALFVTREMAGERKTPLLSVKRAQLRWPASVNGNDSLANLERELLRKAFGRNYGDVSDAIGMYLDEPQFNFGNGHDYVKVNSVPDGIPAKHRNVRSVFVYPYSTSFALLVMEVDRYESNGESQSKHTAYVLYDRVRQHVIERSQILMAEQETSLLSVINKKIAKLNQEKNVDLLSASQVPAEICPVRSGIMFEFQEGDIAPASKGVIDIVIDYDQLKPFLSESFNKLVASNGGYWEYKALRP
ncbi:MAG: hypothetical protein II786_05885 [Muribaculaceae bacterium]|nr:hypothetical protein [Muribaculaceae bacterium]